MGKILLGSASPRRKEILGYFKLPFSQVPSTFDEESVPFSGSAVDYVLEIAQGKIECLIPKYPGETIITADTTVYRNGRIFGKPESLDAAYNYLDELQGQWHSVYSGVCIASPQGIESECEETKVLFNKLTEEQIRHYLKHSEWKDKAGGYAIQATGSLLVRRIEGCFFNVMGLPINALGRLLKKHGVNLWDSI
jgi:septum formation protein